MKTFVVLGVPKGFPCELAARRVLRAAQRLGMDRIRVEKPGHTCEHAVDAVARAAHPLDSLARSGTIQSLIQDGGTFEWRTQNWPGFSAGSSSRPSLQAG
jgi:hypothetical protein